MQRLQFNPGNLEANAILLEGALGLGNEREVNVASFEVLVDGTSTGEVPVVDGKYKSAMFMDYIARQSGNGSECELTDRSDVFNYFGRDLCTTVQHNGGEEHPTIRDLLAEGKVSIRLRRKKG